jgi:hypothetical protein
MGNTTSEPEDEGGKGADNIADNTTAAAAATSQHNTIYRNGKVYTDDVNSLDIDEIGSKVLVFGKDSDLKQEIHPNLSKLAALQLPAELASAVHKLKQNTTQGQALRAHGSDWQQLYSTVHTHFTKRGLKIAHQQRTLMLDMDDAHDRQFATVLDAQNTLKRVEQFKLEITPHVATVQAHMTQLLQQTQFCLDTIQSIRQALPDADWIDSFPDHVRIELENDDT